MTTSLICETDNVAWVAELVDARDLKSLGPCACTSSILVPGTSKIKGLSILLSLFFCSKSTTVYETVHVCDLLYSSQNVLNT